ncbi:MAG: hypothetical protein DI560_13300 [Pseudomonas putida]|nr:MAG: hypothetical protein DI560_13300 [Pseudomonas putida]
MRIGLACHVLRLFHVALLVRAFLLCPRHTLGISRHLPICTASNALTPAFDVRDRNDNFTKYVACRRIQAIQRTIWLFLSAYLYDFSARR